MIIITFYSFVLNPMLPSFYITRGYYRFSHRGWANFRCISSQFGRTENPICMFMPRLNHPLTKPCFAVSNVKNCTSMLGPVFREKRCPGKVGPLVTESTLEKFCKRKKIYHFARANNACARALIVQNRARACSNCLALTKLTRLGEPRCFYGEKLARLGGWLHHRKRVTQLARRD